MFKKTQERCANTVPTNKLKRDSTSLIENIKADFIRLIVWLLIVKG